MSKKETIAAGLEGLLSTANQAAAPQGPAQEQKQKGNYKTVCYSIAPELADKIRCIAYWDRKKVNAVVTEAFRAYCDAWTPPRDYKAKR